MTAAREGIGRRPPTALVIDCDPGVDDAVALALAVASPELDLRAVTTVAGNVPVASTTRNTARLLQAFGCSCVPVAAGARGPLVRPPAAHPPIHGSNGLGGVEVPAATQGIRDQHAVDLLAEVLRPAPVGSVTIAAIGPLTNIALLLALHPELIDRIDRVVAMAGGLGPGNITPVAEFNVWSDPEAAQRVLTGGEVDVCLVGLDVTRQATVNPDALAVLREGSTIASLLADMILGYGDRQEDGWPLHDVLVIAALIDPSLIRTQPAMMSVETTSGTRRGQTLAKFDEKRWAMDVAPTGAVLELAVEVDSHRFRRMVLTRLREVDDQRNYC